MVLSSDWLCVTVAIIFPQLPKMAATAATATTINYQPLTVIRDI